MEKLSAIVHAHAGDERSLARLLETLRPCDDVLVVNVDSSDKVTEVARQYGAAVKDAVPGVASGAYLVDARNDWILSLLPSESLSEALEAALFDWKQGEHEANQTFSAGLREQTDTGWTTQPAVTRLVNRTVVNWIGELPKNETDSIPLDGDIVRFDSRGSGSPSR
jgi:glycosyltransferase involved in cell wall biosynthesis